MAYDLKKASVLIIDDMQPVASLASSILKIFGFTDITVADNAESGFRKFCQKNPDIVLTDWMMEPFDGLELVRKIRTHPDSPNRFVPVIVMTGYSHRLRVELARDAGVTEFLVKPFRAKDLYARIEMLIEKPRKFVETGVFFGPDRRRRRGSDYVGPFRREADSGEDSKNLEDKEVAAELSQLREAAMDAAATDKKK
ncbi:MAG: response regulator [Proteobacteria bacterium]|nr:response regulator [Pseudomonadota bacterium]